MYKIKQVPEDFIVREISSMIPKEEGPYSLFLLKKKDWGTVKACQLIAKEFRIPLKNVGFAGAKDRRAMTEQLISIKGHMNTSKKINEDIEIKFLGYSDKPVSLGALKGNEFEIIVKEIDNTPGPITQIINYFDEQRFSTNNHIVGKSILKKDFKKACELLENERSVQDHLKERPGDCIGAIKTIPLKIRIMFIHAYQSWLFNRIIVEFLKKYDCDHVKYSLGKLSFPKEDIENIKIPLIGFDKFESDTVEINSMIRQILKEENITPREFIIRAMPELSAEGSERDLIAKVKDLDISPIKDNSTTIIFKLQKGSYATIVIKSLFRSFS